MTNGLQAPRRARPSEHALVAYLAPLVERRRVAVVGPASGEIARRCRALGASSVVAIGGAGEGIAVRALSPGAVAQLHGRTDVIVIPDAGAVDLAVVLDEARRALGLEGMLVVAARQSAVGTGLENDATDSGVSYDELSGALAERFASVRMLGTGSFVGFAVAVLDGDGDGVTLDTSLMPDEPLAAESYVAVASDRPLALDAIALVQVPAADLLAGRADAGVSDRLAALEGELRTHEAKTKEGETALAERWVRIQRLEHELKALDEDARKARDRAVKLSKELEDERKLRQRIELDAQMVRRVPEPPRVDPNAVRAAEERVTALQGELRAMLDARNAAERRAADLSRELDETQATEAELRAELDEFESRAKQPAPAAPPLAAPPLPPVAIVPLGVSPAEHDQLRHEHDRLERELSKAARSLGELRTQLAAREAAVNELAYALDAAGRTEASQQALQLRAELAEQSALNVALASEAQHVVEQNEAMRERVTHLEAMTAERETAPGDAPEVSSEAAQALELARSREAIANAAVTAAEARAEEATRSATLAAAQAHEGARLLDEARSAVLDLERRLGEAQTDLTRQYAIGGSAESRAARAEAEVENLRTAAGATGSVSPSPLEFDTLRAELNGARYRLADAEAALVARSAVKPAAPVALAPAASFLDDEDGPSITMGETGIRSDQLLADLAETASRLATVEETLAATRDQLVTVQSERDAAVAENEARPAVDHEAFTRSLVAQLEDRDLRLRAMERRMVEEIDRARHRESEIWEAEIRTRDQRIMSLEALQALASDDLGPTDDRGRGEADRLRGAVATVRAGLSAILVDGRGAVVAHDLVALLRALDET